MSNTQKKRTYRQLPAERDFDPPDLHEDPKNLFTLPYVELIDSLTNILFPSRQLVVHGNDRTIRASNARVDRYILFRAAWQPEFGIRIQLALRDLSDFCARFESSHFVILQAARQEAILERLETNSIPGWTGIGDRAANKCFDLLYETISEGLFGEPGYGGNDSGLGWQYSNFMPLEDPL